jgi:chromosome segregation ATPase
MRVFTFVVIGSVVVASVAAIKSTQTGSHIVLGYLSRVSDVVLDRTTLVRSEGVLSEAKGIRDYLEDKIRDLSVKAVVRRKHAERLKNKLRKKSESCGEVKMAVRLAGGKLDSLGTEDKNTIYRISSKDMTASQVRRILLQFNREIKELEFSIANDIKSSNHCDMMISDILVKIPKVDKFINELTMLIEDLRVAEEVGKINSSVASISGFLEGNCGVLDDLRDVIERIETETEDFENRTFDKFDLEISDDDDLI